ncbi:MAG: SIS domain-containing protein [Cardiobacteriaceae bacterium]|nr:SIS domain-containing protein [Cardiobacteriaceae bacterium]
MSLMRQETLAAADVIAHQDDAHIRDVAHALRGQNIRSLLTTARGSSDHAAGYIAYLWMQHLGLPAASLPPSLSSLYHAPWQTRDMLALAVSQSGASPDLVAAQEALKNGGAQTLALVNTLPSPLAETSAHVIDLAAGREKSVAATKSYIATIAAGVRLLAHWQDQQEWLDGFARLPDILQQAAAQDWSKAVELLSGKKRLFVIGRGAGWYVAREAALKCKETCLLQGEAFSGAEVRHGPMALIDSNFASLIFAPPGKAQAGLVELAEAFRSMGGQVLLAADTSVEERDLTLVDAGCEALQGMATVTSFYIMAEQLAKARGLNPDEPPHLQKVTKTV